MKAAWGLSWAYAACIFVISIIGATSPIALRNSQNENRDRFLNLGSLFGAGVFLSAGFVHLLGDVAAELDDGYPWAMTVSSSALILTMLIEKVVLSLLQQAGQEVVVEETMTPALTIEKNENDREVEEEEEAPPIELPYKFDLRGDPFTAFVMFSALSFHSFLGGLGLGADPENSTAIFIAIMAHKGFAAFALGTNFVRAKKWNSEGPMSDRAIAAWMVLFSLVTPIGVFVGSAMQEAGDSKATAVVIAAASGTFIYVALVEVAIPELDRPGNPLEKVACVVSGYFLMGVLAIWV